jgi:hypothetical protein
MVSLFKNNNFTILNIKPIYYNLKDKVMGKNDLSLLLSKQ